MATASILRPPLATRPITRPLNPFHPTPIYSSFEKIHAMSAGGGVNASTLSGLLKSTKSPTLKGKILDIAHRNKLYQLSGDLVTELSDSKSHDYRLKVNGLLNLCWERTVDHRQDPSLVTRHLSRAHRSVKRNSQHVLLR